MMELRKMFHRAILFGMAAGIALATPVITQARGFQFTPVQEKAVLRWSEEAQEHYSKALDSFDHINYVTAFEHLTNAIKAEPNSMELRFLAVDLARYHGQMNTGITAVRYYEIALGHAEAVLKLPNLPSRQRRRAQYDVERVTKLRDAVDERDQARRTYGLQIVRQYASEVYTKEASSKEIKAFQEAVSSLTQSTGFQAKTKEAAAALEGISAASPATLDPMEGGDSGTEVPEPVVPPPAEAMAPSSMEGEAANPFDDAPAAGGEAPASNNPFDSDEAPAASEPASENPFE